jgi:hypothetical protein
MSTRYPARCVIEVREIAEHNSAAVRQGCRVAMKTKRRDGPPPVGDQSFEAVGGAAELAGAGLNSVTHAGPRRFS